MKIEATIFAANRRAELSANSNANNITRYHRAAIDGYVDMLCEASKRDTNLASDETGLTPTLLAARQGHLEALRILVGRGGDPERAAADGSSALHLAAARNHLNCVSFLVNFGVNMWSLDNELHTAKDVAAIEQRKEVLDYLDQMMAKKSALNTKHVQKLKEKAKVASEKRLKQMRKAQLKVIKQVEKDERYLVKLSNNRRLLKAAHSLSDIKLVGRSDASISYAPSDISGSIYSSERPSPSLANSANFNASPHDSNSNNKHLHLDLRNSTATAAAAAVAKLQQLNGFQQHKLISSNNNNNNNNSNNNNSDESAYGSSISSTSCYMSSGGSSSSARVAPELKFSTRPKYSDLVAMQSSSELSRKLLQSTLGIKPNVKQKISTTTEQQSLKSNSTFGVKLRGIGGVSRKVHLKRLLHVNTNSSSDLTAGLLSSSSSSSALLPSSTNAKGAVAGGAIGENITSSGQMKVNRIEQSQRLCNVQPAIKLKLNSESNAQQVSSRQTVGKQENSLSNIKWPPAPAMTRAISEPDFSSALRSLNSEDDEQNNDDVSQDDDEDNNKEEEEKESESEQLVVDNDQIEMNANQLHHQATIPVVNHNLGSCKTITTPPTQKAGTLEGSSQTSSAKESPNLLNSNSGATIGTSMPARDRSQQQHLLTQCLSQLKMRHESISKYYQQSPDQLIQPSKIIDCDRNRLAHQMHFDNSNELIQHQLNAGQFPLRPSNIKQQQQQQQHHHNSQTNQRLQPENEQHQTDCQYVTGKTTVISAADSIGSASSLAKRNSRSPLKSPNSSPSSSLFYSSSYASSIEAAKPATTMAGCQQLKQVSNQPSRANIPPIQVQPCNKSQTRQIRNQTAINEETVDTFLMSNGLLELKEVFTREKIDLEALMLLSEEDLKSLDILLGPRRKLLRAIENRRMNQQRNQLETCRTPLGPMYVMVDTPL